MPSYGRKRMCKECPFREAAPAGWLGPWTPEQLADAVRHDADLICHVEVGRLKKRGLSDALIADVGQHCVGALRSMNKTCKLSLNVVKVSVQQTLKHVTDLPVLAPRQLVEHHTLPGRA